MFDWCMTVSAHTVPPRPLGRVMARGLLAWVYHIKSVPSATYASDSHWTQVSWGDGSCVPQIIPCCSNGHRKYLHALNAPKDLQWEVCAAPTDTVKQLPTSRFCSILTTTYQAYQEAWCVPLRLMQIQIRHGDDSIHFSSNTRKVLIPAMPRFRDLQLPRIHGASFSGPIRIFKACAPALGRGGLTLFTQDTLASVRLPLLHCALKSSPKN